MSEWKKAFYLILIFFVFLGGVYFFYYYNYNNRITEVNESIVSEQELIDLKKEQINQQIELEKETNDPDYYLYIPKSSGIANILDFFSKTAEKNNVEIEHIEIDNQEENSTEETSTSGLKTLSINMFLSGDYVNIRLFLNEVYSGERLLNLTKWQWENTDKSDINIYLSYDVYYYPNNNDLFLDLPAIPAYNPANRLNPTIVQSVLNNSSSVVQ